ncbi:MAG TPA: polyamine ABC transporter substrate-binding protein [Steroidobacteraceae bacterium]|nr:polyamine ABC transporter substrate-binding protein [Steroidobacteraceae bacterium]
MTTVFRFSGLSACLALAITGCSQGSKPPPERGPTAGTVSGAAMGSEKVVNVYNWADFIAPSVISAFQKEYGIQVNYDVFDSNDQLETKLLTGHANYDVVVPGGGFLERGIKAGVYQKLDKAQLPNLKNLDPEVTRGMAVYDPDNQYAVDYTWLTTTGIGYDVAKIRARMADAPVDSWRMLYEPAVLGKFQDCGVTVLDAPDDVLSTVLAFLGKDPNSESAEDLKAAERVLLSIRPYIRYVDSTRYVEELANGGICLALGWSGDVTQARDRANEAANGVELAYSIPREGSVNIFNVLAIPADAPHPRNAHLFINYLLRPDVAAKNTNASKYASGVADAVPLLNDTLRNDPGVYPPPEVRAKLAPERAKSQQFTRLLNRTWTRFKTGR